MFFLEYNTNPLLFSEWLNTNEAVSFDATRKIRKGYERQRKLAAQQKNSARPARVYKPGTWGLEIEFRVSTEIDFDELQYRLMRDENVIRAFYSSVDTPMRPEDWDADNPEPDGEWSDDPVENWNYISGFERPVGDKSTFPVKEALDRFANSDRMTQRFVQKIYDWWTSGIDEEITNSSDWDIFKDEQMKEASYIPYYDKLLLFFASLRSKEDDSWGSKPKKIYNSLLAAGSKPPSIESFLDKLKEFFGPPSQWQIEELGNYKYLAKGPNGDPILTAPINVIQALRMAIKEPASEENIDFIKNLMEKLFRWHEKQMASLTEEEFENIMSEKQKKWEDERDEIVDEFDHWENHGEREALEEFVGEISPEEAESTYDIEIPYVDGASAQNKINHYVYFINNIDGQEADTGNASENVWGVGEDGEGVVEIRSPICTTKDFPALLELLQELQDEEFDGGTSAHVHVGMPKYTDAFDLIAMTTLADEDAIVRDAGSNRQFTAWAQMNFHVHDNLKNWFKENPKEGGIYTNEEGFKAIKSGNRYKGTNIQSYFNIGTVEFRYLSSQIVEHPELLIQWIQYYLMLPQIATSRKQLRIKVGNELMTITRQPGGNFKVDFNNPSVSQPSESPHDLRNPKFDTWYSRMEKYLLNKHGDKPIGQVPELSNVFSELSNVFSSSKIFNKLYPILPWNYKNKTLKELWDKLSLDHKRYVINYLSQVQMIAKG